MRRACLVFGVAAIGCWTDKAPTTVENRQPMQQRDLTGAYWCTIESGGYTYDPYPCVIRRVDSRFVLAKLGGSQRFTGEVRAARAGFTFDGEFYCPWGDCTQRMHGVFVPAQGGYQFQDDHITVRMTKAADGAYGGVAYGGDGYGGFGYGGATYGKNRGGRRNPRP
jgi:hypothetical protein